MANQLPISESLVLFGAHRWRREGVVAKAMDYGFDVHLVMFDGEPLDPGLQARVKPASVHRLARLSPTLVDDVIAVIPRGAPWYALGLDDYVAELAAKVARRSAMPIMDPHAAIATLHKNRLRQMWNALCEASDSLYPVPHRLFRYRDCTFDTLEDPLEDAGFPSDSGFIVKPNALDASIAINSAETWPEVEAAIGRIRAELAPLAADVIELGIAVAPEIVVEKRIPRSADLHPGAEFSAEFISTGGASPAEHRLLGITQKYIDQDTHVEVAHCFPSQTFPPELVPCLVDAVARLLADLRVGCAISHWEFIVTQDRRLALVEGQLRPGGDNIMELVRLATGCDPYHLLFDALRGRRDGIAALGRTDRVAMVRFPRPQREIHGPLALSPEDVSAVSGSGSLIVSADLARASRWGSNSDWGDRHIAVITCGPNFDTARSAGEDIVARLTLEGRNASGQRMTCGFGLPSPARFGTARLA